MRLPILSALSLALLLAGCLDPPAAAPAADEALVPPPAEAAPPMFEEQTLAQIDVLAPGTEPTRGSVRVPEGAQNVTAVAHMTVSGMVGMTVDVAGCGMAQFGLVVASAVSSVGAAMVCEVPTAGDQEVTVTVDGAFAGSVELRALVPVAAANETMPHH